MKRSGRATNIEESDRTKKQKDGLSKGDKDVVSGNSTATGTKGNLKNDGPIVGERSKKSGSDDANTLKIRAGQ